MSVEVLLSCLHVGRLVVLPEDDDLVWCGRCCMNVTVQQELDVYGWHCLDCGKAHRYGRGKVTSEGRASQHRRMYISHTVELILNGKRYLLWDGQSDTLDVVDGEPPF